MRNKIARTTHASATEYYLHDLPSTYNLVLLDLVGRGASSSPSSASTPRASSSSRSTSSAAGSPSTSRTMIGGEDATSPDLLVDEVNLPFKCRCSPSVPSLSSLTLVLDRVAVRGEDGGAWANGGGGRRHGPTEGNGKRREVSCGSEGEDDDGER
ncbi:putative serine/threonine-protein kinase vps15 [Hordeum vulgare]|nr:putative serine/threonine-protein kinase vps15 [Hordeum vulgare]KAI5013425.1 hypothetical protein ZWY2020_034537 [Hordeum vulgare]